MADELRELALELRRHLAWQASDGTRTLLRSPGPAPVAARASEVARAAPAASAPPAGAPLPEARFATPAPPPRAPAAPAASAAKATAPATAEAAAGPAALGQTLDEVRQTLGDCQRCKLCSGRTQIVFGVGNPRAELVFVGEAPGFEEDRQGVPFVGPAGQLLTRMIEAMQFRRDDVYICNVTKCRPPNNRNPEPDEIAACEPFLKAQLAVLRPKVIVALGKFAAQTLLRDATAITRLRGQWRSYQGIDLMPTFHPAYLLRTPADKKLAWMDLKEVMKRFGKGG